MAKSFKKSSWGEHVAVAPSHSDRHFSNSAALGQPVHTRLSAIRKFINVQKKREQIARTVKPNKTQYFSFWQIEP